MDNTVSRYFNQEGVEDISEIQKSRQIRVCLRKGSGPLEEEDEQYFSYPQGELEGVPPAEKQSHFNFQPLRSNIN